MAHLAGLDLGTGSIKAILYDPESGQILRSAKRPTPVEHPTPQQSEHPPEALWQAVCACLREISMDAPSICGLGISSMAEAGVALDRAGEPLAPIIAWYDRRSEVQTHQIESDFSEWELYQISGQRGSPSFGLTKILWIRNNQPQIFARMALWLPLTAWILYRLTGEKAVDYTIASRSLLLDNRNLDWSEPLLAYARLRRNQLPALLPGSAFAGSLTPQAASETGLPAGIACAPGSHDHLCAAFASGATQPGSLVDSTGSAQAVAQLMQHFSPSQAMASSGYAHYPYVFPQSFVLKAGLKAAGSALAWLAGLLDPQTDGPDYAALEAAARLVPPSAQGPVWLPHLLESGSPYNDRNSRGALLGLRLGDSAGNLYRAMLEALAFHLKFNLDEMQPLAGPGIFPLTLNGGITRNRLLSEIKASVIGQTVLVPAPISDAALGAALLGGMACGLFPDAASAIRSLRIPVERIDPDLHQAALYDQLDKNIYRNLYGELKGLNHRFSSANAGS